MCSPQHPSLFTLVMKFHDRQSSERCIRKLISRHYLEKNTYEMEWFSVLNHRWSRLPTHEAFFSTLKNENISAEDYQLCLNVWKENDMKTMKEVLTWYNNKDVEPMLEAIDKMFQLNQNRRIDMFPDSLWSTCSKTYQTTSLYRMRYAAALTESSLAFWIFLHGVCNSIPQNRINYVWRRQVNAGRLYVLYVFTQSYCVQYPDRVSDIWRIYDQITNQSNGRIFNQWNGRIHCPSTNQKPGKRIIQKSEYTKKQ